MRVATTVCLMLLFGPEAFCGEVELQRLERFSHPGLCMTVLAADIELPPGEWDIANRDGLKGALRHVFLDWAEEELREPYFEGRRMNELQHGRRAGGGADPVRPEREFRQRTLRALIVPGATGSVRVDLDDRREERTLAVSLNLDDAAPGREEIFSAWAEIRAWNWAAIAADEQSGILARWIQRSQPLYGVDVWRRTGPRGESTSIFNVLGGRAAIRETLQMQALDVDPGETGESERTRSLDSLVGVQVKSHAYEEMLAGEEGGRLQLADYVPHDRFLAYFARPSSLAAYLDAGVDFLFEGSSSFTGSSLRYGLKERYFRRLGVDARWVRMLLESRSVTEVAVVLPDLFFIDGTDITVLLRVPALKLVEPALALVGVRGLGEGAIVEQRPRSGDETFWAAKGDLLIVGTSRSELQKVLGLIERDGRESLGRSAEFRYMLTKLPLGSETRAYAYLSDPFIRRLVGPEVKIAQLRRIRARADLETLSAAALLYREDAQPGEPDVRRLAELGYVPAHFGARDYSIDGDFVARSRAYGTPSDMDSVLELSVERVSPGEAKAYETYVENYSRFWRQFFDPIAIRLDDVAGGELELNVFILPLIDSSMYETVRNVLQRHGEAPGLRVPALDPEPVLVLSANLREEAWVEVVDGLESLASTLGVDPRVFDELGPSVHLAVLDSDPVIHLGSGDVLGALGARSGSLRRGRMFIIPLAMTALTRPCKLLVELHDAERVVEILDSTWRRAGVSFDDDFRFDVARLAGRDAWMVTVAIEQLIKLRFSVEVEDGFLVISNIPWARTSRLRPGREERFASASLRVAPGAGRLQLPGLFAAAQESRREATFRSAAHLYPLLLSLGDDVEAAKAWHKRLFGFVPSHPAPGEWSREDGMLVSSRHGSPWKPRQSGYTAGDTEFGVLRGIHALTLDMQLEDDGLRTRFRWSPRKKERP